MSNHVDRDEMLKMLQAMGISLFESGLSRTVLAKRLSKALNCAQDIPSLSPNNRINLPPQLLSNWRYAGTGALVSAMSKDEYSVELVNERIMASRIVVPARNEAPFVNVRFLIAMIARCFEQGHEVVSIQDPRVDSNGGVTMTVRTR